MLYLGSSPEDVRAVLGRGVWRQDPRSRGKSAGDAPRGVAVGSAVSAARAGGGSLRWVYVPAPPRQHEASAFAFAFRPVCTAGPCGREPARSREGGKSLQAHNFCLLKVGHFQHRYTLFIKQAPKLSFYLHAK